MTEIDNLIRKDLKKFTGYVQPKLITSKNTLWLNANEWPWNNQISVSSSDLNRYPEPQPSQLIDRLAKTYSVNQEQLLLTRGSDDAIDLLIRLFCVPSDDNVIICPPTFSMYSIYAKLQGLQIQEVPLIIPNFTLDTQKIVTKTTPQTKLIFLCSPNNPTGTLVSNEDISQLCHELKSKAIVIVDEAYIEFSQHDSTSKLINEHENLVILRTLSKAYGCAAVRLGCVLSQKIIIDYLKSIMQPYPISLLSSQSALLSFSPESLKSRDEKINIIQEEKQRLFNFLSNLQAVDKVWPSQANFVLASFSHDVYSYLLQQDIVVKNISDIPNYNNVVRITIGKPEENNRLITTLEAYNE